MPFQGSKAVLINTIVSMVFYHSSASFRSALGDDFGNRDSLETLMTVVTVIALKQWWLW